MKRLNKIRFNVKAWGQYLSSDEAQSVLRESGERIAASANAKVTGGDPGEVHFIVEENITKRTPHRARVVVIAKSMEARKAEATDAVLTRSLDAGR
jgi:hypothetical protein